MRGRPARCRQVAGVVVTTAASGAARPSQLLTIAAAAALSLVVLLVGGLSPTSGDNAPRPRTDSISDLTMLTSPDTWRTMDEQHHGTRLSSSIFRLSGPRHLRHRRHRQRHRQKYRQAPTSGLDLFRPHSSRPAADNSATSGRRRFRHVGDKSTSDASVFKVVVDPRPSDNGDTIVLEAETDVVSDPSAYFRFCDHRLISSAVDPIRCRSSSDGVKRQCLVELAAIDDEAEVKFQRFNDVMALFDCGHTYSVASHCDDCKVRDIHMSALVPVSARPFAFLPLPQTRSTDPIKYVNRVITVAQLKQMSEQCATLRCLEILCDLGELERGSKSFGIAANVLFGGRGSRMGSAMVPLVRALLSFYKLSVVTIPLSVMACFHYGCAARCER